MGFRVQLVAFCLAAIYCASGCCSIVPVPAPVPVPVPEVESRNSTTLELLHVVFRHGPRTPVDTYPNDPYVNETFYPFGWGHLTNDAKKELFKIGNYLRKRYKTLVGPYYQYDMLHAQSTASPRTLMSMQTVLASMFPPKKTPMEWNDRYNWQPIPIFSEPLDTDIHLRMTAACPRYEEAFQEVLQLPEVKNELKQHEKLFQELSEITGMNVTSALDINSIYITLLAEQAYGLELPQWSKAYFPEKMEFMAAQNYIYNAYTAEMQRIKGGYFLSKMFEEMQSKASGKLQPPARKMFMYCAHDWSITNILSALGVWQRQMPRFSALVAFELHKNPKSGEYFVEIHLKNDPHAASQRLTVPGCDFQCPLEKLIELSSAVIPDASYEQMCRLKSN